MLLDKQVSKKRHNNQKKRNPSSTEVERRKSPNMLTKYRIKKHEEVYNDIQKQPRSSAPQQYTGRLCAAKQKP